MDPSFDSARTAGYRDVVVNLQLVGEDAQRLGVARHVCELQLILVPVFERTNLAGHKRCVAFRNLRGE